MSTVTVHAYVAQVEHGGKVFISDPAPTKQDAEIMVGLLTKQGLPGGSVRYVSCEFRTRELFMAWQDHWAAA